MKVFKSHKYPNKEIEMKREKIFFVGDYRIPGGPAEVNRNLLRCLPNFIKRQESVDRIGVRLETMWKIIISDKIIFSGMLFKPRELKLARFLNKKIIYIMHGCIRFEQGKNSNLEDLIMRSADKVLCVSETYSNLIKNEFLEYKEKIGYLTNGVNWEDLLEQKNKYKDEGRNTNRIILFGGGRITKANRYVCEAVSQINEEYGKDLKVDVYGYFRDNDDSKIIKGYPFVEFHHVIPHDLVNKELAKSILFVQNSVFESFSLATMDALVLGCDLLISKNVGAKDVISGLTSNDVIEDPTDVKELKSKILNVLEHPNNSRLINSIDKESTSLEAAACNLLKECDELI